LNYRKEAVYYFREYLNTGHNDVKMNNYAQQRYDVLMRNP
jgi:hypothetical protein